MSDDLNLAITIPGQPFIFAAPVVLILAILVILVIRKSRRRKATIAAWASASTELGIQFVGDGNDLGPLARGRVKSHVVSITPVHKGSKKRLVTRFSVKFEAPAAPKFNLVKRIDDTTPTVDTGNPKFDAVVSVKTDQAELLSRYLTGPRRAAILRLLTYWPSAQITNREAHLLTLGIEHEHDKLVDSICHLVAAAETFDRPVRTAPAEDAQIPTASTQHDLDSAANQPDEVPATNAVPVEAVPVEAPTPTADEEHHINGESDLLTEVRLDEVTVLNDLFDSGLDESGIAARFQQVYQGREVAWTGEVLRVGSTERGVQRVAAFIGSADGENPESGRVVALTAIAAEPVVQTGDVVAFSGSLVNLDTSQRLFHVV